MTRREVESRPLAWVLIGRATPEEANLADRLALDWGEGACYLSGAPGWPEAPPCLPASALRRLLERARAVVFWRDDPDPDAERFREALEAGGVPVQAMSAACARRAAERHPEWPAALRLTVDDARLAPPPVAAALATLRSRVCTMVALPEGFAR